MSKCGLEISNLTIKYKNFTLKDVNLKAPKGMIFGLVGRNGAGKTTLIKAIANAVKKDSGTILVNGIDASIDRVAYFTNLAVSYDTLNINKNLKLKTVIRVLNKTYPNFDLNFINNNLKKFNIKEKNRLLNNSLGENRKISLLITLAMRPKVLVLDEPTAGVDPADKDLVIDLLQTFIEDENNTLIYSTHVISDLEKIADYIAFMDNGSIKFIKEKDQLLYESYLVSIKEEDLSDKIKNSLIGIKKTEFGINAITKDKTLLDLEEIKYVNPTMESILMHYMEESKLGDNL